MLKRIFIVLGIIVAVLVLLVLVFYLRFRDMVRRIDGFEVTDVDLEQIDDGVYVGEFSEFLMAARVKVAVKDHKITGIDIIGQRASPDHRALETTDRIIKAQSPKVDAVTGATGSSKTIMIAVQNALQNKSLE